MVGIEKLGTSSKARHPAWHRAGPTRAHLTPAQAFGVQREFVVDNLLIRVHFIIEIFGGLASRHGSLNSLLQVALYLPS